MFGKKKDNPKKAYAMDDLLAFIGRGVKLKGALTYNGSVRIDGEIEGEIDANGVLIVGQSGVLDADIVANMVVCGGKIEGEIRAKETVRLLASAVINGKIFTPNLMIEAGACFNGICQMASQRTETAQPALKVVG